MPGEYEKKSEGRTNQFITVVSMLKSQMTGARKVQGPAQGLLRMAELLWLDIDEDVRASDNGNWAPIWVSDEQGSRLDLLNEPKRVIKEKSGRWTRRAFFRQLAERCAISLG